MSKEVWLVCIYAPYYPAIERHYSYESAKESYDDYKERVWDDECIYISKVEEFREGKKYEYDK